LFCIAAALELFSYGKIRKQATGYVGVKLLSGGRNVCYWKELTFCKKEFFLCGGVSRKETSSIIRNKQATGMLH
jgi:hypothetical protein